MTAAEFRTMARAMPGVVESAHMNHPDFRVNGRIFATLGSPDDGWGMVKLTPAQQRDVVGKAPGVFRPCKGAWGERGSTNVCLAAATRAILKPVLEIAFGNVRSKSTK